LEQVNSGQTHQIRFPRDARLLFSTRSLRLFGYGFLSVILALYLGELGFSEQATGLLLTLTLLGDTAISLWITTHADRLGRRRMLFAGASLMILAAALFAFTRDFTLLLVAAVIGVISPSGNEIGPFLSIEQAALSQLVSDRRRTQVFAWYNLAGSMATALGALAGGLLAQLLQGAGFSPLNSYRVVVLGYGFVGVLLMVLFSRLSPAVETTTRSSPPPVLGQTGNPMGQDPSADLPGSRPVLGLHRSQRVVFRLAALFSLDAFAGGFIIQSLLALWFTLKFGVEPAVLGAIFFGANLLAGLSALSAAWVAGKIGLVNTMVFTHLPSNILLILVPFMPTFTSAVVLLFVRFSISQMDVPTRQSYTMAVVAPDERSAASGITNVARTIGAALSPVLSGLFLANPAYLGLPFIVSGGLKIIYDLALFVMFRSVKPPEEIPFTPKTVQEE
jgi:MFS family permease